MLNNGQSWLIMINDCEITGGFNGIANIPSMGL